MASVTRQTERGFPPLSGFIKYRNEGQETPRLGSRVARIITTAVPSLSLERDTGYKRSMLRGLKFYLDCPTAIHGPFTKLACGFNLNLI